MISISEICLIFLNFFAQLRANLLYYDFFEIKTMQLPYTTKQLPNKKSKDDKGLSNYLIIIVSLNVKLN